MDCVTILVRIIWLHTLCVASTLNWRCLVFDMCQCRITSLAPTLLIGHHPSFWIAHIGEPDLHMSRCSAHVITLNYVTVSILYFIGVNVWVSVSCYEVGVSRTYSELWDFFELLAMSVGQYPCFVVSCLLSMYVSVCFIVWYVYDNTCDYIHLCYYSQIIIFVDVLSVLVCVGAS